jgi:hypothetical protein
MRSSILIATLGALLLVSQGAQGATRQYLTPILAVTTSPSFNGCLVKVERVSTNLGCESKADTTMLTMDCEGEWMDEGDASNNLRQAQIALLTGKKVNVVVNDRFTTPQGYCLAQQITLFR